MIWLILILGLGLRLISLNQSFWLDEATSAQVAKMELGNILTRFSPSDFHPPLYYLLLKVWTQFFWPNEISARLLSVLFGLLTIYLVYLIGKKLFERQVGIFAALLLATSGLHIYYSQEARMYSMATFFTCLAVYLFTRVEEGRLKFWILFSISLRLVFFSDYLPISILLVFWFFAILFRRNFNWRKKFISSQVLLVGSIFIWLPIFLRQFLSGLTVQSSNWWNILGRTTFKEILLIPTKFIIGRTSIENKLAYPLLIAFLFIIFGFLIFNAIKNQLKKESVALVTIWLFVPVLVAVLIGFKIPVLSYFRLIFVLPAFYLLIAKGISNLDKRWQGLALTVILVTNLTFSFLYLTEKKFQREDWRGLVNFVESQKTKNSITIFIANSNMEAYRYYSPNAKIAGPSGIDKKYDQIWLMRYVKDIFDPEDKVRMSIESLGYKKQKEYDFNGVVVFKYESRN